MTAFKNSKLGILLQAQKSSISGVLIYDNGIIRPVDGKEFEERFGVKYLQYPVFDSSLPPEFYFDMEQEAFNNDMENISYQGKFSEKDMGSHICDALDKKEFWNHLYPTELNELYGGMLNDGKTAPVFIGNVSEVLGDERFDLAGYGLFVNEEIVKGQFIGQATGNIERVPLDSDWDPSYAYIYRDLRPDFVELLNCLHMSNALRYMNHSKNDNVNAVRMFFDDKFVTFLVAKKDILTGSQILFDYGNTYWEGLGIVPMELF